MSTRSTLLTTEDNEHWYKEGNAQFYENTKTEECLVLQFDKRHVIDNGDEGFEVIIEEGTPLYNALLNKFYGKT